jgi:isocitrate/isopropylmalate dehydrogenase
MTTHPSAPATKRIAVIPGDGIGKEVIPEAVKVLKAVTAASGKKLALTEFDWGADRYLRDGTTLPADAVEMFHRDFRRTCMRRIFCWGCVSSSIYT